LLAYVFWHVPRPGHSAADYESAHHAFHDALWESPLPGLRALRVHRLERIPWLAPEQAGYEDWHLVDSSAALDELNEQAVTHARQLPHDRVAAMAASGTAGLYALRSGALIEATHAHWLSKPAGMSYGSFDASLKPWIDRGACLWARRMTLGPAPEFCLQATREWTLPHPAERIRLLKKYSRGPR
jgi:hypothetical protein